MLVYPYLINKGFLLYSDIIQPTCPDYHIIKRLVHFSGKWNSTIKNNFIFNNFNNGRNILFIYNKTFPQLPFVVTMSTYIFYSYFFKEWFMV